jgi:hypothetical protein
VTAAGFSGMFYKKNCHHQMTVLQVSQDVLLLKIVESRKCSEFTMRCKFCET